MAGSSDDCGTELSRAQDRTSIIATSTELTPTLAGERFELLDVVRGVALFGIVSANMISYSLYLYLPEAAKAEISTHAFDRVLDFCELLLIEGKFYTIFSVLFGVGFSVLLTRARAKQIQFHRFFLRRIFILFAFGVAHALLFWHNDILQAYAVCGSLLLPMLRVRDRSILLLAVLALLAPLAVKLAGGLPTQVLVDAQNSLLANFGFTREARVESYAHGSWIDIVRLNLTMVLSQLSYLLQSGMIFRIYGCFLLGFYLGRNEVYKKLEGNRPTLQRLAIGGLVIGVPLNAVYAATVDSGSWLEVGSATLGIFPLSAAYVALCCLVWLDSQQRDRLRHFAAVGRMALTNYVGQSVLCTLVFYGTGVGLGGTIGPTLYLPIGLAVYALQVQASRWWLERFRFGPLEWVWRMLSYGERFPLAKRAAD